MANVAIPGSIPGSGTANRAWRALGTARRYPIFPVAILLLVLVFPAIFAEWVAPHDPVVGSLSGRLAPPFWVQAEGEGIFATPGGTTEHILGTDKQGRDILSRIIYGARVSLTVAAISIFLAGTIGTALGLMAGYFGGNIDHIVMRAVDICLSMPAILFALVLAVVLGPSFQTVIIVIVSIFWSRYARLVRGETLGIKSQDFVAQGKGGRRFQLPDNLPPCLPQRGQHHHRARHPGSGAGHPAGVYPQLPGRRPAAPDASVGTDGCRRAGTAGYLLVADGLARHCHTAFRAFHEPAGRLAARPAGPQAAKRLNLFLGQRKSLPPHSRC